MPEPLDTSAARLRAVAEQAERSRTIVAETVSGKIRFPWTLRVPAQPDDYDLVVCGALADAAALLRAWADEQERTESAK